MESNPTGVLRHVGRIACEADCRTDDALLAEYLQRRDERAFATLLQRHGPLVLGVCRRTLHDPHDVEDAFQASFLVLLRKAKSLRRRERLGAWLYGVAYRVALKARYLRNRRRAVEQSAEFSSHEPAMKTPTPIDGLEVLDQELLGLPERYRLPLILCELQGLSRREAARQLRLPEGTLSSRLARGRQMLRQRLVRRGVAISAVGVIGLFADRVPASVPRSLVASTLHGSQSLLSGAAVLAGVKSLMEGVLADMLLTKLKFAATAVVLLATLIGLPILLPKSPAADPPAIEQPRPSPYSALKLDGVWRLEKVNGRDATGKEMKGTFGLLVFENGRITNGDSRAASFHLNESTDPKEIDWNIPGELSYQWIYKLDGDTLTMCGKVAEIGSERPKEFKRGQTERKIIIQVLSYRRVTKAALGPTPMALDFGFPTARTPSDSSQIINSHRWKMPFQTMPGKLKPKDSVSLFQSTDAGQSWKEVATAKAQEKSFDVEVLQDGEYWFAIEAADKQPVSRAAQLRIVVDTLPPRVQLVLDGKTVRWQVIEDHLDLTSFKFELRTEGEKEWQPAEASPAAKGVFRIGSPLAKSIEVRLIVNDLAGNKGTATIRIPADVADRPPAKITPSPKGQANEYEIEPPDIVRIEGVIRRSNDQPNEELPRPLAGAHLVRPDGTIGLGRYGSVRIAGLGDGKAVRVVSDHLAKAMGVTVVNLRLGVVEVNSKSYYVCFVDSGTATSSVLRQPLTGTETVQDAFKIGKSSGLITSFDSNYRVWIARPASRNGIGPEQILTVDLSDIARDGKTDTNYQLSPGDRVYISKRMLDPPGTQDKTSAAAIVEKDLGIAVEAADKKAVSEANRDLRGGLRIKSMAKGSVMSKAGIEPGDIIVSLHHWEVVSLENAAWVLSHPDRKSFSPMACYFLRGGHMERVMVELKE